MADLRPLDLALLPVWGLLRPSVAAPIHWGTFYPAGLSRLRPDPLSQPPREFKRLAAELAPEVRVEVLEPGSEMPLTR